MSRATTTARALTSSVASSAVLHRRRPLVFLDIDGVLNRTATAKQIIMEEDKVRLLARALERADADVVLSTYWRAFESYIAYALERQGVRATRVVGRTSGEPHLMDAAAHDARVSERRVEEIAGYLRTTYGEDESTWPRFAIVDDKAVVPEGHAWYGAFVRTVHDEGLTEAHAERLSEILSVREA